MLISEHIAAMQKLLDEKGDQDLFMWVDSGQDTIYIALVPELEINEVDGAEYDIEKVYRNKDGKILVIGNLNSESFDEDKASCQDPRFSGLI